MDPITLALIMGAAGAAQGGASAVSGIGTRKTQAQLARDQMAAEKQARNQTVALSESTADPFRQQMFQAGDLARLDLLERGSYTPTKLGMPSRYAAYAPNISGGFSYEKSPELISSAATLKRNIMGGNVAPTMTDPSNYGKTATLNLLRIAADGVDPGTVSGAAGAPRDVTSYMDNVERRMPGGAFKSETRGTDMTVQDAARVLERAIQAELGRAPQPGEIEQLLASQGLKSGDRFVGQAGLMALLGSIRSQGAPLATPSYTGRG